MKVKATTVVDGLEVVWEAGVPLVGPICPRPIHGFLVEDECRWPVHDLPVWDAINAEQQVEVLTAIEAAAMQHEE